MYNLESFYPKFIEYLKAQNLSSSTLRFYKSDAKSILEWFFKNDYQVIDKSAVKDYVKHLKSNKTPSRTINRKLSTLRKISEYLKAKKVISKDFMGDVRNVKIKPIRVVKDYLIHEQRFNKNIAIAGSVLFAASMFFANPGTTNQMLQNPLETKSTKLESSSVTDSTENFTVEIPRQIKKNGSITIVLNDDSYEVEENRNGELPLMLTSSENLDLVEKEYGTASIKSGSTSTTVYSSEIAGSSHIFITPTSPTNNQILYVEDQGSGYAVISIENKTESDIVFNWWVIN